jgi:hypothetical protein
MALRVDALLSALVPAARAVEKPAPPQDVFRRLQFVARALRHAPAAGGGGPLLLWFDPAGAVASAPVGSGRVILGRDPACDVVVPSPKASRRHAVVRRGADGTLELGDLGSANGTTVNGTALPPGTPLVLADGDVIEIGGVALAVLLGNETGL